jgi:hypothetical protein
MFCKKLSIRRRSFAAKNASFCAERLRHTTKIDSASPDKFDKLMTPRVISG